MGAVLALAVSMIRRTLPDGCTVSPTESSAPRNSRYASSGVISSGATMVTFLLLAGMVPGKRNCLQVIDEIQAMRSPSSVSGLRFSFTIRFPDGNFLQELNSFSPITAPPSVPAAVEVPAAGTGTGGRKAPVGEAGWWRRIAGGVGAGVPGGTRTGLPSAPLTTAARAPASPSASITTPASNPTVRFLIVMDVVVLGDLLSVAFQPDGEVVRRPQLGVDLERLVGAVHLHAVDGRDDVAVLEADLSERSVRLDAEQPEPDRFSVPRLGDDARRLGQRAHVPQERVYRRVLDLELVLADLLDPPVHRFGQRIPG